MNSFKNKEFVRFSTERIVHKKNIQISRILRLKDPNITIIYVLPFNLTEEMQKYFTKILTLNNIEDFQKRLFFLTPENIDFFPKWYSMSKILYYSSKCMNYIK